MATAKKLSRKELKRPDEFVHTGQTIFDWMGAHKQLVFGAVAGALALGLLIAVGTWWFERREVTAAGSLGSSLEVASRPVVTDATKAQAQNAPFFATEQAKREALEKAYAAVREHHPGSQSAAMAALQLGNLAFDQKNYDEAKKQYEAFLAEAPEGNRFRFAALENIGLADEAKGDLEAAAKDYQRLVDEGGAFYQPFGLVRLADTLERLGRKDEARRNAQKVVDDFGTSPARRDAEALLEQLGPAPAPAAPAAGTTEAAPGEAGQPRSP